jgi:hypothetical protein
LPEALLAHHLALSLTAVRVVAALALLVKMRLTYLERVMEEAVLLLQ